MSSPCPEEDEVALELPLTGWCVIQCCVDDAFTIKLWGQQREFSIRIEADFAFVPTRGAEIVPVRIGSIRELAPVLEVFGSSIDRAVVYEDRKLRSDFSNGMSICVEPDENYEAWVVSSPHGFLVVALPGGGIATWRPEGERGVKAVTPV